MPQQIEDLETEQSQIIEEMGTPTFFQEDPTGDKARAAKERLDAIDIELEASFARWEELDNIRVNFVSQGGG